MSRLVRQGGGYPARNVGAAVVRSRLFRKYVALFVGVVCVALIANGVLDMWFAYREHSALLGRGQRDQATAAAGKIGQFIDEVQRQIGWMTLVPWSSGAGEQQYLDALRLLRQVPAITELTQLDASGREQLRVSRLAMDAINSGRDLSGDPKYIEAVAHKVYYGPVYFRRGSEPYMTISQAGKLRDSGVSIAEVNLKFIWDVVSKLKFGERGYAYVVDAEGRLIAHPDINLVLRHSNLSQLAQVRAALAGDAPTGQVQVASNLQGQKLLTAHSSVAPLGWTVFVELPFEEAYAPLFSSMLHSGALLLAALALAVLAGLTLARRMVVPIQALCDGVSRIGRGEFDQHMTIATGDELEMLGAQFNRMAAQLQNSYANLERQVEERTRQLEAANLSKSRFIAAASHDLRQPLQALGLFVGQLRGRLDAAERRRVIECIGSAIAEMNELFNALLDISKLDSGVVAPDLTEFPVSRLLAKLDTSFARAAQEKGLRLRVVPSRAWVRTDFILLERILLNLVSNAVHYTFQGGVVVGCRRRAGCLRIEVYDSGPGIPEDQRQKIFGEFYQLANPQVAGGIGLGLAIVDRLCRLLDLRVELASSMGKGSRFTVAVPMAAARASSEAAAAPELGGAAIGDRTVVVIDDAALVLDGLGGLLRSWGVRVIAAGSSDEAFAQLAILGVQPDLIVSDHHLRQGQTGIGAIAQMRSRFGGAIPAFLMSGDTSPERLRQAREHGYVLLHKPISPTRLRAVLDQMLRHPTAPHDATRGASAAT